MADPKDVHKETFREEAYELIGELEEALLRLEEDKQNQEIISRIFRALHTIKGSGSMFGFDDIAFFTHNIENAYELVRNGDIEITKEIIDLTLKAKDYIHLMLDASTTGEFYDDAEGEQIIETLKTFFPIREEPEEAPAEEEVPHIEAEPLQAPSEYEKTYRISFSPEPEIFMTGVNPAILINDLRAMGRHYVAAHVSKIPDLDKIDPEKCYTHWVIILTTAQDLNAIKDVFLFVEDMSEIKVDVIDEAGIFTEDTDYKKLGEILIDRGALTKKDLESVITDKRRLGEILVEKGLVEDREVESALGEQQHVKEVKRARFAREAANTIRVASEKLDRLVNLVGELVTVQARLSQTASEQRSSELLSISEEVERLTSELHDNTMSIRMVPIGSNFTMFKRQVRDLSDELGRYVTLKVSGGETELDKTVIERLSDPLVHIIRNAIDHGIESPDVRESVGKPRHGTIHLSAAHSGADVLIQVSDDGAGLNEEAIRSKAVSKGLIEPASEMTKHELLNIIFSPGFSTTKKVTDVSGRGVGMDVVKKNIDALRGTVEIDSNKGIGTTISLRIPLTLAIIDGLLIRLGPEIFVLPLSSVDECVELTANDVRESSGRDLVHVRGEMVPYVRLREKFSIDGERPEREQIVILEVNELRVGFAVDSVIGEHQTVIKSLSRVYKNVRGVSGATILGDGTVALILDIPKLVEDAEAEERETVG
jgi:two-component system chemotaxis sensor kinase CheA